MILPVCAVDLVERRRVAGGDQEVAVGRDLGRVDVEVLPLEAGCGRGRDVRLGRRDVAEAVPLEQHGAGREVDLLDDVVDDARVARPAPRPQVAAVALVGEHDRGVARRDRELVQVERVAVAGAHGRHLAVVLVVDLADAVAVADEQPALPPGQHGLALVGLHAEVGGDLAGRRLEPDEVAAVVDDHRPVLAAAGLGGEEDEPGRAARLGGGDGDGRRAQVGPRLVLLHRAAARRSGTRRAATCASSRRRC